MITCDKVYFRDEKRANEYVDKLKKTSNRLKKPIRAYLCTECLIRRILKNANMNKETPIPPTMSCALCGYFCHNAHHFNNWFDTAEKDVRVNPSSPEDDPRTSKELKGESTTH